MVTKKLFIFVIFVFKVNRKTNDFFRKNNNFIPWASSWEERVLNLFPFPSKRSPGDEVESLTLKTQSFSIKLNLSVLKNTNIKNRTWIKVVNIASLKSSLAHFWEHFPLSFLVLGKAIMPSDEVCWPYVNQSILHSH